MTHECEPTDSDHEIVRTGTSYLESYWVPGYIIFKVPLRGVVDFKSGPRLKRGNTGYVWYICIYMSVARFAGVVPLLLLNCANAFEIQRKCWLEFVPR